MLALWASVSSPVEGVAVTPSWEQGKVGSMLGVGLEAVIVTHPEGGV